MTRPPLAIDLFCGLGGWTEGLQAAGFYVIGFDIEAHSYGGARYPGQLVIQDVRTLHGAQFRDAALIVGSSPCQEFSYRAMPWRRARELPPPELGIELFNAQFRIQREASEAAGRHIAMVVENVRGAQKWVGRAAWNFGSYYLWGDVPALMPTPRRAEAVKVPAESGRRTDPERGARFTSRDCGVEGRKNGAGSWFAQGPRSSPGRANNPARGAAIGEGRKGAGSGTEWFDDNLCRFPSHSPRRKAASAQIAKIPLALSTHVARVYRPAL